MSERPPAETPAVTRCSRCGSTFECGAQMASCWCQQLPPLEKTQVDASTGCYCPNCLAALVAAQQPGR